MSQTYLHIRPISFRIPTLADKAAPDSGALHGIPVGNIPQNQRWTLIGSTQELNLITNDTDLHMQLQRFLLAMDKAHAELVRRHANVETELKLFVAPEFYFRPSTGTRLYTREQLEAFQKVLRKTIANAGKFYNWMIIAGTFYWQQSDLGANTRPKLTKKFMDAGKKVYYNTGIVVRVSSRGASFQNELDKVKTAFVDHIPAIMDPAKGVSSTTYNQSVRRKVRHARLFEIGGLKIGLDICLEHAPNFRELRNYFINLPKNPQKHVPLHAHVVTAAGMFAHDFSTACEPKKLRFRVDGYINNDRHRTEVNGTTCETIDKYMRGQYDPFRQAVLPTSEASSQYELNGMAIPKRQYKPIWPLPFGDDDVLRVPMPNGASTSLWNLQDQGIYIYPPIRTA